MKPRSLSRGARWKLATIACGLALLTAGCGSSSSSSSLGQYGFQRNRIVSGGLRGGLSIGFSVVR